MCVTRIKQQIPNVIVAIIARLPETQTKMFYASRIRPLTPLLDSFAIHFPPTMDERYMKMSYRMREIQQHRGHIPFGGVTQVQSPQVA